MNPKKILSVFGTRPEAIKMAPVIKELENYPDRFQSTVCVTAQHRMMLDQALDLFKIIPDYDLDLMKPGQDLFDVTCNVLKGLKPLLGKEKPDMVLVHGDTTTTMAASMAAFYCQIPVGHVEAGLRTFDKFAPFPEEVNRKVASVVADLHFAPTDYAKNNLLREGVPESHIHITGNTVVDALFMALNKIKRDGLENTITFELIRSFPSLQRVFVTSNNKPKPRIILVTGHRRENFGNGFENICAALVRIAQEYPDVEIVYPVHLNPNVQEPVKRLLETHRNIHLVKPLEYLPFLYLMERSHLVLTDSGGVQEEAPSLGKPVLVMRETTERPEAVAAGTVLLVGTSPDKIFSETKRLLDDAGYYKTVSSAHNPYGDGQAAKKIVAILASILVV